MTPNIVRTAVMLVFGMLALATSALAEPMKTTRQASVQPYPGLAPDFSLTPVLPPEDIAGLDPEAIDLTDELQCLAMNIYHEARGESIEGRMAVAYVTLNRMASDRFPDSICAVVKQGGETRRHRCQFSWWCDGRSDRPLDQQAWHDSVFSAIDAVMFSQHDTTGKALFYHADYVKPSWARKMTRTSRIGRHIFYRDES